mmetsp:Transcript_34599/g.83676  ORF Transcript_34599/g.83676 Transcript_34599/m.83676 type:complete len:103 (+) Transcript_34599:928-1236(+)
MLKLRSGWCIKDVDGIDDKDIFKLHAFVVGEDDELKWHVMNGERILLSSFLVLLKKLQEEVPLDCRRHDILERINFSSDIANFRIRRRRCLWRCWRTGGDWL